MDIEYIAAIPEHHYKGFKIIMSTTLPADYVLWLRVRERAKQRAFSQIGMTPTEIPISPLEFARYCERLKKRDFSIATLDACARAKGMAQG
jgi:hypothetical protein